MTIKEMLGLLSRRVALAGAYRRRGEWTFSGTSSDNGLEWESALSKRRESVPKWHRIMP